ncbi:MAG: 50S ribosomal protein L10 [Pseudomonadota bacterium]|nr:50S ribosomal protein L10 [Pseudomonadota bacterium]
MGLSLNAKQQIVSEVAEVAANSTSMIAADFSGIRVGAMTQLRAKARDANVHLRVVKNSLIRRAVEGTDYALVSDRVVGPVLLAFSAEEPGAAARLLKEFRKEHEAFTIKFIAMDGRLLEPDALDAVAALPTRDEALARLMGVMKAPITKLAQTLAAPHQKLVLTLAALREQKQE